MLFKDVSLRNRRVLLLYKVYVNSALLVLKGTSLNIDNALLALSHRYNLWYIGNKYWMTACSPPHTPALSSPISIKIYLKTVYTGWPRKNGTAYFPQYVDAITSINVLGNFSWEKLYQDQQFWFSSLFSRAHFVRQWRGPNLFPFQLKLGLNKCHFGSP